MALRPEGDAIARADAARAVDAAAPTVVEGALPNFSPIEIFAIMSGLMLAMFLASLDQTVVATSLSTMAKELSGWDDMAWVVTAYLVASTVTTPIYGRLSDLYGRRRILLISIGLFVGGSILCGLAPTMTQLIAARLLQGLGGGGLRSVSQAVVADIIPPRERGRYQGYFSSTFAISNAIGPVLGGFFADYLSWRWIFWINIPLGAAAFLLSSRNLRRLRVPDRRAVIDWLGAALIVASTTPLLIGMANVQRAGGWRSPYVIAPILLGTVFIGALVLRERVAPEPMLPLRLFASRIFSMASLVTFLTSMVMVALIIIVPLDYQIVAGVSANAAGTRLIPMTIGTVAGSFIAGQLISRTGRYRIFPIIGTATGTLACAAIAIVGLGHHLPFDIAATILLGLSFGGQMAPMTVSVQNALEWRDTGIGMSCLMFFRLMGGAFGVALFSAILIGGLTQGALAVPGHEVLGPSPGLALFHLGEIRGAISPALFQALAASIGAAFAQVFAIAAGILAVAAIGAAWLKELPLRGRE